MSERDSRMERASSALTASTGQKPASSTMSTARMRRIISSSTMRTFGISVGGADMVALLSREAACRGSDGSTAGRRSVPRRNQQFQQSHSRQNRGVSFAFSGGTQNGLGDRANE